MAVDMFLKVEGIQGESPDQSHGEEIEVLAWSWGVSQTGSFDVGTGGGAGKANFQELSVTKYTDIATPTLMLYCAQGKHIGEITLTVRKAGGDNPLEYVIATMKDVIVSSISAGGSSGEERLTENATFAFGEVKFDYSSQKRDGSKDQTKTLNWNIRDNSGSA